jgi:hypothetical protein
MKRTIRVKIEYLAEVDDDGLGIPHIELGSILQIAQLATPNANYVEQSGKFAAALTRESSFAARRLAKEKGATPTDPPPSIDPDPPTD